MVFQIVLSVPFLNGPQNPSNKRLIQNLKTIGFKIDTLVKSSEGNLNGKTFVLTGTLKSIFKTTGY